MSDLKEYIVTLKNREDLDAFYDDMETPGGDLYIPDRAIEVSQRRAISRNTHYMLTDEEASQIRNDPRVLAVEQPPQALGIKITTQWDQSGNFEKSSTISSTDKNWGLYRVTAGDSVTGWGVGGSFAQYTGNAKTTSSGKNVDVVIVDAHINPDHPEFAVNADGTGGSRVNQIDWFTYSGIVGISTTGSYSYATVSSNHGTHVAGTACGNTQGWARDANIYNMEFDYTEANAPANWELYIFDYLRAFHLNKSVNPSTGRRNPTVTNHSWGYSYGNISLTGIQGHTYRGTYTDISALSTTDKKISLETAGGVPVPAGTYLYRMPYVYAALDADVADAVADGIIVVAAAGNSYWNSAYSDDQDYDNSIRYSGIDYVHSRGSSPARGSAIVVGNVGELPNEYKRNSSNFGNRVDIWAPGSNIVSAVYDSTAASEFLITLADDPRNSSYKIGSISGTSMASPQVCGVLACYAEQNQNLKQDEALEYLITHSKKNQIATAGVNNSSYYWFGDNGNNRYLFYKLERPVSGQSLPRTAFKNRPAAGAVYPRVKIRAKG